MSSVARGRCLVLTTIIITLLGNLVLAVLPPSAIVSRSSLVRSLVSALWRRSFMQCGVVKIGPVGFWLPYTLLALHFASR
jgi:hypothetical protein